jgi:hypothetical protein
MQTQMMIRTYGYRDREWCVNSEEIPDLVGYWRGPSVHPRPPSLAGVLQVGPGWGHATPPIWTHHSLPVFGFFLNTAGNLQKLTVCWERVQRIATAWCLCDRSIWIATCRIHPSSARERPCRIETSHLERENLR